MQNSGCFAVSRQRSFPLCMVTRSFLTEDREIRGANIPISCITNGSWKDIMSETTEKTASEATSSTNNTSTGDISI